MTQSNAAHLSAQVTAILDRARQQVDWRLYDQAIQSYDQAIALSPHCLLALQGKAAILNRLGRWAELQALEAAITTAEMYTIAAAKGTVQQSARESTMRQSSAPARNDFEQGVRYFQQGQRDRALAAFDRAIDQNPHAAQAWQYRGIVLSYQGDYGQAVAAFDTALRLNPKLQDAWIQRGLALDCMARRQAPLREAENTQELLA